MIAKLLYRILQYFFNITPKVLIVPVFLICFGNINHVFSQEGRDYSLSADIGRSIIGMMVGGSIGGITTGFMGKTFSDNDLSVIAGGVNIGIGVGTTIGSSLALHLSNNREDNLLQLTGITMIPTLSIIIPFSVKSMVTENANDIFIALVASSGSVLITMALSVIVYRHFPLKVTQKASLHFGEPYIKQMRNFDFASGKSNMVFLKLVEVRF